MQHIFVDREFDRDVGGGRRRTYPAGAAYHMPDDHAAYALKYRYGHAVDSGEAADDGAASAASGRRARASGGVIIPPMGAPATVTLTFPISPLLAAAQAYVGEGGSAEEIAEALVAAVNDAETAPVTATFEAVEGNPATIHLKAKVLGEAANALSFEASALTEQGDALTLEVLSMSGGKG